MSELGGIALALIRPPARLADRAAMRLLDQLLAAGFADQIAARLLEGPEMERIVARAVESPGAERIVARVIESHLLDEAVARLLESKDLWLLVDEIARSPSVTQAISHQSVGFAEEMAGVVRTRSQKADARVERIARRLLRREVADGNGA
jgi:ribosomal protein S28E/S33